jgi:radical SAM protein with 4Fe4S-binding SPASM domain
MDCPEMPLSTNGEYLAEFRRRTVQRRVPLSGGINLTNRCNLGCVHCYIRNYVPESASDGGLFELKTERILPILDDAAAAGCLFFLITGGEPLLHPDFPVVYRHARELGMLVTVFTNGTLLDESHIGLFSDLPPRHLEITLYGATEETYESVTGVAGSYAACHRGLQLLAEAGLVFKLKAMLLTLNQHELQDMERQAKECAVSFRFDSYVVPALGGDRGPLKYRVDPQEAVDAEMSDPERREDWVEYVETRGPPPQNEHLYKCGTGITSFHIDAFGRLQPCLMVTQPSVDLTHVGFETAWRRLAEVRDIEAPDNLPCGKCPDLQYCGYCPPALELENSLHVDADSFVCRLGQCRREAVQGCMKSRRGVALK